MPRAKAPAQVSPPPYDLKHAGAIQALARGDATEHQQRLALDWIVNAAAATYDLSFSPQDARLTDFAEGRRFVGLQIVKMTKLPIEAMKRVTDNG